jgi:hypothetical protein
MTLKDFIDEIGLETYGVFCDDLIILAHHRMYKPSDSFWYFLGKNELYTNNGYADFSRRNFYIDLPEEFLDHIKDVDNGLSYPLKIYKLKEKFKLKEYL